MDGTLIYVTWIGTTIDDIGSFFIYKISAIPISSSRSRQIGDPIVKLVLSNETLTTLIVEANERYSVSVIYVTLSSNGTEIEGPSSPLIIPIVPVVISSSSATSTVSAVSSTNIMVDGNIAFGVGTTVALVVVIFINVVVVVVVLFFWLKRKHKKKFSLNSSNENRNEDIVMNVNVLYGDAAIPVDSVDKQNDAIYEKIDECYENATIEDLENVTTVTTSFNNDTVNSLDYEIMDSVNNS
jgi:uncharacterized membrane protein